MSFSPGGVKPGTFTHARHFDQRCLWLISEMPKLTKQTHVINIKNGSKVQWGFHPYFESKNENNLSKWTMPDATDCRLTASTRMLAISEILKLRRAR